MLKCNAWNKTFQRFDAETQARISLKKQEVTVFCCENLSCLFSRHTPITNHEERGTRMNGQHAYEKLGLLYLGRELDLETREPSAAPLLFKNKNLTTHAAIIGMTGSGKTGLGIGLIEEAIMDNVPSIIIDPKGDMGNLLLTFPELSPSDFAPWIDPAEAAKKEMVPEAYAEKMSKTWAEGLASWGQGKERIAALRDKTDFTIYTPGSGAGVSISVLNGFQAPSEDVLQDMDTLNDLVNSTTVSLLTLVDLETDSLQSREHILVSSLLYHFWRKAEDLTLETLIGHIVNPPFDKVGVFGLETYYPQSERMSLAMRLNNVLASPAFELWRQGEPLDIQRILYTTKGRPRTAIFSIAHLSETERMFFVTLLLNQVIGWMRRQQGSGSLKALLYMDEIFGYFPPTANPPSKKPMLLLLKQARAYGIGIVLATQNPVDLDYKGLSNIGTWCVGRLQTSQDQKRVLTGIVGASDGKLDREMVKRLLSDMKGRQFLLTSAHLDEPLLFETRWVLSYLRGPISTNDIERLMQGKKKGSEAVAQLDPSLQTEKTQVFHDVVDHPPMLSRGVPQCYYLHPVHSEAICFEPWLLGQCSLRFFNAKRNIDIVNPISLRMYVDENLHRADWESGEECTLSLEDCVAQPPGDCSYYPLPSELSRAKDLRDFEKSFAEHLYQSQRLELYRVTRLKLESHPGESIGDFTVRVGDQLRERKDAAIEKIKERYQAKQERLEVQILRAEGRVEKEKSDVSSKTTDTILSIGAAVLGAFFGRKVLSATNISKASRGVRNVGRIAREKGDVKRAEEVLQSLHEDMDTLALEVEEKVAELTADYELDNYPIESFFIKPRRSDIFDVKMVLFWEMVTSGA